MDWRWQLAQQLIKRRQDVDRFVDDESVYDARAFYAALGRRPDENQLTRLADYHQGRRKELSRPAPSAS